MRRKGEGSIYKDGKGRHVAALSTRRGRVYLARKKKETFDEFSDRVAKKIRALRRGESASGTLAEVLEDWIASISKSVRPRTLESYSDTVRIHIAPQLGMIRLSRLTPTDVERMMGAIGETHSTRTVAYSRSVLRRALRWAEKQELVSRNVAALTDPPKVEKRPFTPPEENEWEDFLEKIRGHDYEALFLIWALLGARRGEALALTWGNVEEGYIRFTQSLQRIVVGKKPDGRRITRLAILPTKNKSSERAIPIPKMLQESLGSLRTRQEEWRLFAGDLWQESDLVFTTHIGTPIDPRNAKRIADKVVTHHIHKFRHIAASQLLAEDVPLEIVSELLGHSSIRVTKDIYGHIAARAMERLSAEMEKLGTRKRRG